MYKRDKPNPTLRRFICISGKAQSGKDTSAKIFKIELEQRGYRVLIIHFADLLKFICKTYFGWNGNKDTEGRELLQFVGTDIIRKAEPNFWVDFVKKLVDFFEREWDYIIIPDVRFPNELERLRADGDEIYHIRIVRQEFENKLTKQQQCHSSETALDDAGCDYTLINGKTLRQLRRGVVKILESINARCTSEEQK